MFLKVEMLEMYHHRIIIDPQVTNLYLFLVDRVHISSKPRKVTYVYHFRGTIRKMQRVTEMLSGLTREIKKLKIHFVHAT